MYNIDDTESAATDCAEQGHSCDGPEDKLEVEVFADVSAVVSFTDGHGQDGVGDHPRDDHVSAYSTVIVFLLLGFADGVLGDFEPVAEIPQSFVVARVDVELLAWHFELDGIAFAGDGGTEISVDDIVTFGAPGDVVGVAESVDLQGADVGGEEGKVLRARGEHMPGIKVQEGHEEVDAKG